MKITDSWAAGFIEGDGCFTVTKSKVNGKHYSYPTIKVSQKNHEPLYWMKENYGGSVSNYTQGGKKWWSISGKKAIDLHSRIHHLLSDKRKQQAIAAGFTSVAQTGDRDIHWFAGLYEAEGCAVTRSNGNPTYKYPSLLVTQYYSGQILDWSAIVCGVGRSTGPFSAGDQGKVAYLYRVNGTQALALADSIYTMVSEEKRIQIKKMKQDSTLGRKRGGLV